MKNVDMIYVHRHEQHSFPLIFIGLVFCFFSIAISVATILASFLITMLGGAVNNFPIAIYGSCTFCFLVGAIICYVGYRHDYPKKTRHVDGYWKASFVGVIAGAIIASIITIGLVSDPLYLRQITIASALIGGFMGWRWVIPDFVERC